MVETGLTVLTRGGAPDLDGCRVGLILNQASINAHYLSADDAIAAAGNVTIVALFGPQHGALGDKQDNMIESNDFTDRKREIPVHSLYGAVRKPTPTMLDGLDALVFDLQDVGVRVYTFVWTMTLAMEACREAGVRFVVLDRPNPVGGTLREGSVLRDGFQSFVGRYPIPLRHGLTAGELARVANVEFGIECDLDVIPCSGWTRNLWFDQTELPFVAPSPNIPTLDTCAVFPGMVLIEGTNLSEGRGTTKPFELFGAPYLDPHRLVERLHAFDLPGVIFRACHFEPTFNKHAGQLCGGAQIHVRDRLAFRPVETAVTILRVVKDLAPDAFAWSPPPYEYEQIKPPIDILWGNEDLRRGIDGGASPTEILATTHAELAGFERAVSGHLLYP